SRRAGSCRCRRRPPRAPRGTARSSGACSCRARGSARESWGVGRPASGRRRWSSALQLAWWCPSRAHPVGKNGKSSTNLLGSPWSAPPPGFLRFRVSEGLLPAPQEVLDGLVDAILVRDLREGHALVGVEGFAQVLD